MTSENLFMKIEKRYDEFSKTNKKIATYIKGNVDQAAFLSINELEKKSGVSKASISRFTKEIGFLGYSDFQKALSKLVLQNVTPMQEIKHSIMQGNSDTTLENIIKANTCAMETMYSQGLQDAFNKMLHSFQNTKGNIYIMASRSSYSVAYYLYFMLSGFMKNVYLLSGEQGQMSLQLIHTCKEDSLIAISYSKYSKITFDVVDYFFSKGCNITAITDSHTSPIAMQANQVLLAKNASGAYSFVGAMTIANAIVVAVGKMNAEDTLATMKVQDEISEHFDIYL